MFKLDRFLYTPLWEQNFQSHQVPCLARPTSDHFPLLKESKSLKRGPCPFKFDNRCLSNKDLAHSIQNKWETVEKVGHPGFAIMKALKELASMCRLWNAQVFKKELTKAKDIEK